MTTAQNWNQRIIEEFRTHGGKVGGPFEHSTMLLLTTTGAKSGQERVTPLVYLPDGDRFIIFASKGGAPTNPDWYHNLLAHPQVTLEVGSERFTATATEIKGEERDRFYARQVERAPGFGEYEQKTTRKIPVIALVRNK